MGIFALPKFVTPSLSINVNMEMALLKILHPVLSALNVPLDTCFIYQISSLQACMSGAAICFGRHYKTGSSDSTGMCGGNVALMWMLRE